MGASCHPTPTSSLQAAVHTVAAPSSVVGFVSAELHQSQLQQWFHLLFVERLGYPRMEITDQLVNSVVTKSMAGQSIEIGDGRSSWCFIATSPLEEHPDEHAINVVFTKQQAWPGSLRDEFVARYPRVLLSPSIHTLHPPTLPAALTHAWHPPTVPAIQQLTPNSTIPSSTVGFTTATVGKVETNRWLQLLFQQRLAFDRTLSCEVVANMNSVLNDDAKGCPLSVVFQISQRDTVLCLIHVQSSTERASDNVFHVAYASQRNWSGDLETAMQNQYPHLQKAPLFALDATKRPTDVENKAGHACTIS